MKRLKRGALVSVLALLGLEAGLRWGIGLGDPPLAVLDPQLEYRLVPGQTYHRWGNEITINALGLRGPDISPSPAPGTHRILLIGDSVVYGTHHIDQSEIIAVHLEQALTTTGCAAETVSMAVSSWGPQNQRAALRQIGALGSHDAVIVVSAHDLYDVIRDSPDIVPYRLQGSRTAITDAIKGLQDRQARNSAPRDPRSLDERAALSLEALEDMVAILRSNGITPILAYHATVPEAAGAAHPARAIFADFAMQSSTRFVDLTDLVEQDGGYRDHIHPNAIGAARIAQALGAVLGDDLAGCL